jgi:molecular chaperone GrpE
MAKDKDMHDETVDQEQKANETNQQEAEETVESKKEPTIEDKYNELNDKYVRLHAEFDNYRRRTNKEKLDTIATASSSVLKDLLSVLDDFERAIANNDKVDDIEAVKEGFKLIHHKIANILNSKGLKEMKTTGEVFDSELHEAVANMPAEKKKDKGKIIDTIEKGYYINDKVLRYAKVVVAL